MGTLWLGGGQRGWFARNFTQITTSTPPPLGHCPRDVIHPPKIWKTPILLDIHKHHPLGHCLVTSSSTFQRDSQAPPLGHCLCDVIIHIPKGLICSFLWPIFSSCFARISPTVCPNFTHCLPEFFFFLGGGGAAAPLPPPASYAYAHKPRLVCRSLPRKIRSNGRDFVCSSPPGGSGESLGTCGRECFLRQSHVAFLHLSLRKWNSKFHYNVFNNFSERMLTLRRFWERFWVRLHNAIALCWHCMADSLAVLERT